MFDYEDTSHFLQNYCAVVTKKYWAVKKQESGNLTTFALFSFL